MANFVNDLPSINLIDGRHPLIVEKCKDKSVLHIGCVDSGILEERWNKGELLHCKLDKVTKKLIGVDIDKKGVRFLIDKGFTHTYCIDITDETKSDIIKNDAYDIIVLSEVLEHVDNVGCFLLSVKSFMKSGHTKLIVTVPNAFNIVTLLGLNSNKEIVHPDHHYWFSYITITNILYKYKFTVTEKYIYVFDRVLFSLKMRNAHDSIKKYIFSPKSFLKDMLRWYLLKKSFYFGDGIFLICEYSDDK